MSNKVGGHWTAHHNGKGEFWKNAAVTRIGSMMSTNWSYKWAELLPRCIDCYWCVYHNELFICQDVGLWGCHLGLLHLVPLLGVIILILPTSLASENFLEYGSYGRLIMLRLLHLIHFNLKKMVDKISMSRTELLLKSGASPCQTKWVDTGHYGWGVGSVPSQVGGRVWGYNIKLIITVHNDSIPETHSWKKWGGRPPRGNTPDWNENYFQK